MGGPAKAPITVPTDPAKLGYLAALLDGEGNVGIASDGGRSKNRSVSHFCYVQISGTSMALMEWLLREVGGGVSSVGQRNERCREGFVWKLYGKNAATFLAAIEPLIVIKQAQVAVALEFFALGSGRKFKTGTPVAIVERREELRQQMLELNRKGPPRSDGLEIEGRVVSLVPENPKGYPFER